MTHPMRTIKQQPRALALLFVLLALAMRLFYAPLHLAQEEHDGVGGHPLTHEAGDEGHEDDGHTPHPALDHANDLIAQRSLNQHGPHSLSLLPMGEGWSHQALACRAMASELESKPLEQRARLALCPRGPPEVV